MRPTPSSFSQPTIHDTAPFPPVAGTPTDPIPKGSYLTNPEALYQRSKVRAEELGAEIIVRPFHDGRLSTSVVNHIALADSLSGYERLLHLWWQMYQLFAAPHKNSQTFPENEYQIHAVIWKLLHHFGLQQVMPVPPSERLMEWTKSASYQQGAERNSQRVQESFVTMLYVLGELPPPASFEMPRVETPYREPPVTNEVTRAQTKRCLQVLSPVIIGSLLLLVLNEALVADSSWVGPYISVILATIALGGVFFSLTTPIEIKGEISLVETLLEWVNFAIPIYIAIGTGIAVLAHRDDFTASPWYAQLLVSTVVWLSIRWVVGDIARQTKIKKVLTYIPNKHYT